MSEIRQVAIAKDGTMGVREKAKVVKTTKVVKVMRMFNPMRWYKAYKTVKAQKQAELKYQELKSFFVKLMNIINHCEKSLVTRTARKQFRADLVKYGFVYAPYMQKFLDDRQVLEELKVNIKQEAKKRYKKAK